MYCECRASPGAESLLHFQRRKAGGPDIRTTTRGAPILRALFFSRRVGGSLFAQRYTPLTTRGKNSLEGRERAAMLRSG